MVAPIGGFSRFKSNIGDAIGGMALANFQDEAAMAKNALNVRSQIKAAKAGADATRFAGEQMANATMFGGIMGGVGGLASGVIGGLSKMGSGSGGSSTGSASDPTSNYAWGAGDSGGLDINYDWRPGPSEFTGNWQSGPAGGWNLSGW